VVLEPDEALSEAMGLAIQAETGLTPCVATTEEEAVNFIDTFPNSIFAAIVDFGYSGAQGLLNTMTANGIPAIAYGDDFSDDVRKHLSTLSLAAVVTGEGDRLVKDVGRAVGRMTQNQSIAILVVDDSRSMRMALMRFLTTRRYKVVEAENGTDALKALANRSDIKLVITDNEMPGMDGFSLVREIRKSYSKDDLAVIGISAKTNSQLSVKFITNGANDFLHKPFVKEELYCRVDHNVDMLRRIAIIRDLSNKDPLTRLYNRRYFFEHCDNFLAKASAKGNTVVAAMIDIDHFKKFNDTYGHDVGDTVLTHVSHLIADAFSDDAIVARFGGEEFCILAAHSLGDDIFARYDKLRRSIDATRVKIEGQALKVTVSIGLCKARDEVLTMIKIADSRLYHAKESGRNRVVTS